MTTRGDFLQGLAEGNFRQGGGGSRQFALSWHSKGMGVRLLTAPRKTGERWTLKTISTVSQDEALSAGDIDRDGDLDLLLGTKWLENTGNAWTLHDLATERDKPDRNRLADMNGDGRLDAVVGFRTISRIGDLLWYEQPERPDGKWRRWPIARILGPMSLDVADWDNDSDLNVVAGEHNLKRPQDAEIAMYINIDGNGRKWEKRLIHRSDERHDGALFGDLDVASVGWGHNRVVAYENQ